MIFKGHFQLSLSQFPLLPFIALAQVLNDCVVILKVVIQMRTNRLLWVRLLVYKINFRKLH